MAEHNAPAPVALAHRAAPNWGVMRSEKRVWIKLGVTEQLDAKQQRLINLVLEKIQFYYRHLYRT